MNDPESDPDGQRAADLAESVLHEAEGLMATTLDYEQTLAGIARLAVRALADFCLIDVVDDGEVRRLEVAHADPSRSELVGELLTFQLDRQRPHLSFEVLEKRQAVLLPEVSADALGSMAQDPDHHRILRALHVRSLMAIPLIARDRLLAVVIFVSSSRSFDENDLAFAERLGRVAALGLDNARLFRDAQRALLERDRVLGIVAHDLRNPLNTIVMSAEVLLLPSITDAQRDEKIQIIIRSSRQMNRLIQDLLDVARVEAGRLVLHCSTHRPEDLAREAVDLSASLAAARSLQLHVATDPSAPAIWADHDRILQVLSNLVGNAIKFTDAGGRIDVRTESYEGVTRFAVADSGRGIQPDDLLTLFHPFWKAERHSHEGGGFGLMIARGIVEAHGGRIWAESTPGVGSTFYFTVPPAPGPAPNG